MFARVPPIGESRVGDDQVERVRTKLEEANTRRGRARVSLALSIHGARYGGEIGRLGRNPPNTMVCALFPMFSIVYLASTLNTIKPCPPQTPCPERGIINNARLMQHRGQPMEKKRDTPSLNLNIDIQIQ